MRKNLQLLLVLAFIGFCARAQDTVIRSLPSPLPSPPFPTSDWDGAPLVGVDGTTPNYPLQKALGLTKSKIKIYGWVDVGGDLSTSKHSNAPTSIPTSMMTCKWW